MLSRSLRAAAQAGCRVSLAHVLESNLPSRRTFERMGFTVASTLEELTALAIQRGFMSYRDLLSLTGPERIEEAVRLCRELGIRVKDLPASLA